MSNKQQNKPGVWSEAEDELLALWQGRVGNKWSEVAKHIPGKSGQQCAQRWRHRVNPNISREKWSEDEDARLATLVAKYGHSWAEISRRLPGRTDQQCMGRWRRHLDPSIKRDGWDPEEDRQLRELYAEYGSSWSCISKSMLGRTAQQCRARWCQLTNAERPSRSAASRSKSSSSAAKHAADVLGDLQQPSTNLRRQSTANTSQLADPATLFAAAAAEAGGQRRAVAPRAASRRLSTVSEVGVASGGSNSWGSGEYSEGYSEEEESEEEEESPEFRPRRTTARTAGRASRIPAAAGGLNAAAAAAAVMAAAGLPLPRGQQQHLFLQPPASAAAGEQQVPTPSQAAMAVPAAPRVQLPPPLTLDLVGTGSGRPAEDEEDSPALTQNAAPHAAAAAAATADLLSPLRAQLPPAPPLFTPNSSGRKRTAASRLAAFGPALPPLVIPDAAGAATVTKSTPVRPGSGPMSLELRSPNVLTLLQSPPPLQDDHFLSPGGFGLFRSPAFGSMVTPPWAKSGSSGGSKTAPRTGPHSGQASLGGDGGEAEEEGEGGDLERRHSVARRLDSAPSFGSLAAAGIAASAAAAAAAGWQQQQPQQQQPVGGGSLEPAGSFDFGTVLGSPPKKSKMMDCSPGGAASQLTQATAGTPWMGGAAASAAGLSLAGAESAGGQTSLAMAVQQHLLLASTAKAGQSQQQQQQQGGKENGAAPRQATLTAAKPPAGTGGAAAAAAAGAGSPAKGLTSSNVRMRLHELLETV